MKVKETKNVTLRPVHPRPVRHHGLFGKTFVGLHMMVDKRWTPDSLTQEFSRMNVLLRKHNKFTSLEKNVQQKQMAKTYFNLQKQCRDGRSRLKLLKAGVSQEVRNILKNHRHMKRLYQKMPLPLAEENINQRTFTMRKERDRLECRLHQLEKILQRKLLEGAHLENRIRFENEFKLKEATQIEDLTNKLEKSTMRLRAVKTINATYRRIKQILHHDEIFYEPILRSLDDDMEDQSLFIKHILHLGSPALERFKELAEQYRNIDYKVRKSSRKILSELSSYRKQTYKPLIKPKQAKPQRNIFYKVRSYLRETQSMLELKKQFEEIEEVIKKIRIGTLSSSEKNIYPKIKSQARNNLELVTKLENDMLGHKVFETKMKHAAVLQGVLTNNLTEDEIKRLEKIEKLKEAIKHEDEFEEDTQLYLKNKANVFVVLRYFLWNLHDIMAQVDPSKRARIEYPVDYLKLPLLKFEMLIMKTCAPDPFEQNIFKIFNEVHEKLKRVTNDFDWDLNEESITKLRTLYCNEKIGDMDAELASRRSFSYRMDSEPEVDKLEEARSLRTVLNRDQIKLNSARFVEAYLKRDD